MKQQLQIIIKKLKAIRKQLRAIQARLSLKWFIFNKKQIAIRWSIYRKWRSFLHKLDALCVSGYSWRAVRRGCPPIPTSKESKYLISTYSAYPWKPIEETLDENGEKILYSDEHVDYNWVESELIRAEAAEHAYLTEEQKEDKRIRAYRYARIYYGHPELVAYFRKYATLPEELVFSHGIDDAAEGHSIQHRFGRFPFKTFIFASVLESLWHMYFWAQKYYTDYVFQAVYNPGVATIIVYAFTVFIVLFFIGEYLSKRAKRYSWGGSSEFSACWDTFFVIWGLVGACVYFFNNYYPAGWTIFKWIVKFFS